MGRQDVARQHDPVAGPGEAIAQLDVLDGRPGIEPGVEAAEVEEDARGGSMPQPVQNVWAGRMSSLEVALLVDEMMEQVAILADDARGGRRVVVRAEEGREARVGLEPGQGPVRASRG